MFLKNKISNLFTVGRSGSEYCADLVQLNLGITLREWFAGPGCDNLISKGVFCDKEQYLSHVFFCCRAETPQKQ
jgi:hypothetical protein